MADGSNTNFHYVAEVTAGTTPVSPVWNTYPCSGFTIGSGQDKVEGANIKNGRYGGRPVNGAINVGGDINADFVDTQFNDFIEAVFCGTWVETVPDTSDIFELVTGNTRRFFSLSEEFGDLASGNKFRIFKGMEFNTFTLNVSAGSNVTCTFGLLGQEETTAADKGGSVAAVTGGSEYTTFEGNIKENGVDTGVVTEISLTIDNGMESRPTVFTGRKSGSPSIGLSKVTGNYTVYFESMALYEKTLNGDSIALEFTLTNGVRDYKFELPLVDITGQPDVSGAGAVTLPLSFEATFDDAAQTNIKLTNSPSV